MTDKQRDGFLNDGRAVSWIDPNRMVLNVGGTILKICDIVQEDVIPNVEFPTIDGPVGQKYYPGFCPAFEGHS